MDVDPPSAAASPATAKRKRSPDIGAGTAAAAAAPPPKQHKTHNQHLQINYLARQYPEDLPLVSNHDALPSILALLAEYQGVLERHESMAGNMGARPLGPILIKRFERLFDGPPRVIKTHAKDAHVTWLDVVEFARSKPEQFHLAQMSEGVRVCQFYTKQCRVQISEEDYCLINSGIPQKMIPPQPIIEDEEKELGTLEILEKTLAHICQSADTVAARCRQLNHRLKNRKQAILDRRAVDSPAAVRASSPSNVALMNGADQQTASAALASMAQQASTSTSGFVAVNARPHGDSNGQGDQARAGASPTTHDELRNKFFTLSDRVAHAGGLTNGGSLRRPPVTTPTHTPSQSTSSAAPKPAPSGNATNVPAQPFSDADYASLLLSSQSPMAHSPAYPTQAPANPANNGAPRNPPPERDDGGPFKVEMVARMEGLGKGERVLPPCDRCRRLHMDCLKNLTACQGCTKKHAKCSWKEVREEELRATSPSQLQQPPRATSADGSGSANAGASPMSNPSAAGPSPPPAPAPAPASASGMGTAHIPVGVHGLPTPFEAPHEIAVSTQPTAAMHPESNRRTTDTAHTNGVDLGAPGTSPTSISHVTHSATATSTLPPVADTNGSARPHTPAMSPTQIEHILLQRTARARDASPLAAATSSGSDVVPKQEEVGGPGEAPLSRPPSVPPPPAEHPTGATDVVRREELRSPSGMERLVE